MTIRTISVEGNLYTNEGAPLNTEDAPIRGDDGLAEVETDDGRVTLHLRHYADEQACLSLEMKRPDALALSEILREAAGVDD